MGVALSGSPGRSHAPGANTPVPGKTLQVTVLPEATFGASHAPKGIWKIGSKSNSQPTKLLPNFRNPAPRSPKYKFLPLRKKFGQHFIALKGTEEADQLRREARKGRKWSFVGKGKDRRQRKRNWGASPMSSAPPDPAGRPSGFPRGHLPSQAGRGPGRCPSSGDMSLPPNVELGGPRSRGERTTSLSQGVPGAYGPLRGAASLPGGPVPPRLWPCAHTDSPLSRAPRPVLGPDPSCSDSICH